MQSANDRPPSPKTRAKDPTRPATLCNRDATGFKTAPSSIPACCHISNSNKTSFKISPNSHKQQHILISNRNITPRVAVRKSAVAVNKSAATGRKSAAAIHLSPRSRDPISSEVHALSSTATISNRQSLARLKIVPNSHKTKARHDF